VRVLQSNSRTQRRASSLNASPLAFRKEVVESIGLGFDGISARQQELREEPFANGEVMHPVSA
jgi:hypothetical protein